MLVFLGKFVLVYKIDSMEFVSNLEVTNILMSCFYKKYWEITYVPCLNKKILFYATNREVSTYIYFVSFVPQERKAASKENWNCEKENKKLPS